MTLTGAALSMTAEAFIAQLTSALEATEMFVVSHDLTALHALGDSSRDSVVDEALLDSLLGGRPADFDDETYVPVLSGRFPLLAATGVSRSELPSDVFALVGPIAEFHRDLFDGLEARRRRGMFTPEAQLQWSLLPLRAAVIGELEVAGALLPAASVAGDAYDFAVTPAGRLTVLAMDAMGHGVTATLSTSLALATMRTVRRSGGSLLEQVSAADAAILDEYGGDRFITMAAIEVADDSILVINAGHEPVRRLSPGGGVASLDVAADPPLGLEGLSDYRVQEIAPLQVGEALALLTDGASEARDGDGKAFGEAALNEALSSLRGDAALQTANRIGRAVMKFIPGELNDDVTTVVVQRNAR